MKRLQKLALFCLLTGLSLIRARQSIAQHAPIRPVKNTVGKWIHNVHQTFRDYHSDKPFQYQPSDPETRSKLFREHTHHHGLFYNCDYEECKRYSPYICWKVHHEQDFPRLKFPTYYLHRDIEDVRRRVRAGSCRDCQSCGQCTQCLGTTGYVEAVPSDGSEIQMVDGQTLIENEPVEMAAESAPVEMARIGHRPVAGLIARTVVGVQRMGQRVARPMPSRSQTVVQDSSALASQRVVEDSVASAPLTAETCQCENCAQARNVQTRTATLETKRR